MMIPETISADYDDDEVADSVIGRLEVLGVPVDAISKVIVERHVKVTALVEDRLFEKAGEIMKT